MLLDFNCCFICSRDQHRQHCRVAHTCVVRVKQINKKRHQKHKVSSQDSCARQPDNDTIAGKPTRSDNIGPHSPTNNTHIRTATNDHAHTPKIHQARPQCNHTPHDSTQADTHGYKRPHPPSKNTSGETTLRLQHTALRKLQHTQLPWSTSLVLASHQSDHRSPHRPRAAKTRRSDVRTWSD
jgi:hypothetical protein